MSVLAIVVPLAVSAIATIVYALITGGWGWRGFVAMWAFGFLLLILPSFIRP